MTPLMSPAPAAATVLPATVELCANLRDGVPCLAPLYRPDGRPWCYRCGAREPGVIYRRDESAA